MPQLPPVFRPYPKPKPTYDAHRPNSYRRGYGGKRWQQIRLACLQRDPLCVECKRKGRLVPSTDADHVTPKRNGGTDDLDNLMGLCHQCHSRKTAREGGFGR